MYHATSLASCFAFAITASLGADVLNVPTDYTTIQAAIDAADPGDTVLVADGVYNEAIDLLGKAITVESVNGAESTMIDGTGINTSLIRCVSGEGADTIIRGLKVYKGVVGSDDFDPAIFTGGGMFVNGASPTIDSMVFERCESAFGGGFYAYRSASVLTDCIFLRNYAAANGGGAQIFLNDPATGVGVTLNNCVFSENASVIYGGGIYAIQGDHTLNNCTFNANGRLYYAPFTPRTDFGGGIGWFAGLGTTLTIIDCDVADNTAKDAGGGLWVRPGYATVEILDSTICDNTNPEVEGRYVDLGGNTICDCPADLNGDGIVDGADISGVIAFWGVCSTEDCDADINFDGIINGADLALLLSDWGICSPQPGLAREGMVRIGLRTKIGGPAARTRPLR